MLVSSANIDCLIDSLLFEYGNFISLQKKLLYMKAVLKQK